MQPLKAWGCPSTAELQPGTSQHAQSLSLPSPGPASPSRGQPAPCWPPTARHARCSHAAHSPAASVCSPAHQEGRSFLFQHRLQRQTGPSARRGAAPRGPPRLQSVSRASAPLMHPRPCSHQLLLSPQGQAGRPEARPGGGVRGTPSPKRPKANAPLNDEANLPSSLRAASQTPRQQGLELCPFYRCGN